ncbi:MAG: DUF2785 domain-containing protein [Pseudomonadota bacterium]
MRLAIVVIAFTCGHAAAACPPVGTTRAQLEQLKSTKWELADGARRQALAIGMLDCLRDPDPVLRDDIGFEALQFWMRGEQLDNATVQAIRGTLQARLAAADPSGFARPFAALALAEVARIDRRKPFLSSVERLDLVSAANQYLSAVRDYRGFDQKQGWRHGVAHGADLMLQLALNPALGKAEHEALLAAIGSQVLAADAHFYVYGEGERLMAPVFYLARRDTLSTADWETWFARLLAAPKAPQSQAALARRHNLNGFLLPLYASLAESADAVQRARLLPIVTKALKQLD